MFLKIGHRGAAGLEPENTLTSFAKAIDLGVDMVELDVHLTKDKKLIVIHDDKLNRTTNGRGLVKNKTLKQIKKLCIGKKEIIPTLEEVFDLVNKRVIINIELKGRGIAKPVARIVKKYVRDKKWPLSCFFASSFKEKELRDFKKLCPKIKLGLIAKDKKTDFVKSAKRLGAFSLNLSFKLINKKIIKDLHNQGFKVFVWTINKKNNIKKIKSLGVDGIVSDFPNKFNAK